MYPGRLLYLVLKDSGSHYIASSLLADYDIFIVCEPELALEVMLNLQVESGPDSLATLCDLHHCTVIVLRYTRSPSQKPRLSSCIPVLSPLKH